MAIKRIPARRIGMTEIPATLEITGFEHGHGMTPDERAMFDAAMAPWTQGPPTFTDVTTNAEAISRKVLVRHGARIAPTRTLPPTGYQLSAGFFIPGEIQEASEVDYAVRILVAVRLARAATDLDWAKKFAWAAGALVMEAHMKFRWEKDVEIGLKVRGSPRDKRKAGAASGETRRQKTQPLAVAVVAHRQQHPTHGPQKTAVALLLRFGRNVSDDRRKAIDRLAKQIARLKL